MGWSIIKQSNNKYSLWSTVIDNFICIDATKRELKRFIIREKLRSVIQNIRSWFKEVDEGRYKNTIEDCLDSIKEVHGKKEYNKIKKEFDFLNKE